MTVMQNVDAKICLTSSGCLIHEGKVMLVKHKKMKTWLCPGGHIEENELPHRAAEREFWEETGVKVKAFDPQLTKTTDDSEYLPNPILSNLHWVCEDNFYLRTEGKKPTDHSKVWKNGCEQHCNFFYLVKSATKNLDFKENLGEVDGISWFSLVDLDDLDLYGNVKMEIKTAFSLLE